jgi:hypothetical protein
MVGSYHREQEKPMFSAILMAVSLSLTPPVCPPIPVPTTGLPSQVHPPKNVRPYTPPVPPTKKDKQ